MWTHEDIAPGCAWGVVAVLLGLAVLCKKRYDRWTGGDAPVDIVQGRQIRLPEGVHIVEAFIPHIPRRPGHEDIPGHED